MGLSVPLGDTPSNIREWDICDASIEMASSYLRGLNRHWDQGDKRLITPCIDGSIAKSSEVTLAKLPIYGDIEIKEVN